MRFEGENDEDNGLAKTGAQSPETNYKFNHRTLSTAKGDCKPKYYLHSIQKYKNPNLTLTAFKDFKEDPGNCRRGCRPSK